MNGTAKCFMLEDLNTARYRLRRYVDSDKLKCPLPQGYHNALGAPIEDRPDDRSKPYHGTNPPEVDHADPRWPKACACGYVFVEADHWQVHADGLYRRADTGEITIWDDAPAGAICDCFWWPDKGADGHAWLIKLPGGGDWMTESHASNCDHKKALPAEHRCWTRTGTVPNLTVSPSIFWNAPHGWHGFLRDGVLAGC